MAASITTVSTPTQGSTAPIKTVTVAGANLFVLAALYLNDATQWNRIAEFNGLNPADPWLTGVVTLQIPAVDPNATGGIYGNS